MDKFWNYFTDIGLKDRLETSEKKKVVLLNVISVSWSLLIVLLVAKEVISYVVGKASFQQLVSATTSDILQLVVFVVILELQYNHKYKYARWIFIWGITVRAIVFLNFIRPGELTEYGLIQIPLLALLLFDRTIIHLGFLGISVIASFATIYRPELYEGKPHLDPFVLTVFYIGVFLAVKYFKEANLKSERLLGAEKTAAQKKTKIIAEQKKELEQLSTFKDHFFVNISHEIRTPLTIIKGYAHQLSVDSGIKKAEAIYYESVKIQRLVDNIIDLSRLDKQQIAIQKKKTNLYAILHRVAQDFEPLFSEKGISLSTNVPNQDLYIMADAVLIESLLNNLLFNAYKYGDENGQAAIQIVASPENLNIEVFNTGQGIAETELNQVFEPYYRAKSQDNQQGSGLGLAVARGIAEEHGFWLTAESMVDVYAQFILRIPAKSILPSVGLANNEANNRPSAKQNILLVEDNLNMQAYISSLSILKGYSVILAKNGTEALDAISNEPIDLIITDFMMPGMDGLELIEQLRIQGVMVPVIVITAQTSQNNKLKLLRAGIDGYLTKPFMEEELKMLITKSLNYNKNRIEYLKEEASQDVLPPNELQKFHLLLDNIIEENLSDGALNVKFISDQLHMTERTLFRRVKELNGSTPAKYINEYRLRKAKLFYEENQFKNIRQLALAVGYQNSTRFKQKFRTAYGIDL